MMGPKAKNFISKMWPGGEAQRLFLIFIVSLNRSGSYPPIGIVGRRTRTRTLTLTLTIHSIRLVVFVCVSGAVLTFS
jgi:hypothetical protein